MTILDKIIDVKKEEVKKLHKDFTPSRFSDSEFYEKQKISFFDALSKNNDISIIAEIKKASPSKGVIREDFNHFKIAEQYIECGADVISILTDVNFFQGKITYLNEVAKIKTVPLLRKDFIIDEYQIYEAKANGADVILLIAEALSKNQIQELTCAAHETDLEVLLEFHSIDEISKIDFSLNKVIGINNRNLATFNVDLQTTIKGLELIPEDNLVVSESGISVDADLDILKSSRTNAILVGEHLMRKKNIGDGLKELKEWCQREG